MKPNEKQPGSVILKGRPELEFAKWAADVLGPPGLVKPIHNAGAAEISRVTRIIPESQEYTRGWIGMVPTRTKTPAKELQELRKKEVEIPLDPATSQELLEALHKQAKLRKLGKVALALRHPLAYFGATKLNRSMAAHEAKE